MMGLVVADIPQVSSQLEQKEMAAASSWIAPSLSCQSVDDIGILRSLIGVVSVFILVERYRGFCMMGSSSCSVFSISGCRLSHSLRAPVATICVSTASTKAMPTITNKSGRPATAIAISILFLKLWVFIRKNFLVNKQNVVFGRTERQTACILAALVGLHAQQPGQPVGVVYQVAAAGIGLGHQLQAVAAGRDKGQHRARPEGALTALLPQRAGVWYVVYVSHVEAVEHGRALLAPRVHAAALAERGRERGLETQCRQAALHGRGLSLQLTVISGGSHALAIEGYELPHFFSSGEDFPLFRAARTSWAK